MTSTVSVRSSHQRTKIWLFDLENILNSSEGSLFLVQFIVPFPTLTLTPPSIIQLRGEVDLETLGRKEDLRSLTSQAFRKGGPNPLGEKNEDDGLTSWLVSSLVLEESLGKRWHKMTLITMILVGRTISWWDCSNIPLLVTLVLGSTDWRIRARILRLPS